MWLFALFIAVPLIEIGLFIQVGGAIGLWPTLIIVVATAVLGSWMVRTQGAMALENLRNSFGALQDPSEPLAHGAMILFSGALLLTPGFFTDAVGFALLIPPIRAAVFRYLKSRVKMKSFTVEAEMHRRANPHRSSGEDVIDGEFTDVTPEKRPTHPSVDGPSGWTKH
ncbi:MAG: FxsA family protein [Rhodobacteraceae bacterium]|nr:FxsA family protein [Paracoccaceae bacterium]